jgi:hypothetical protein
MVQSAFVVRKKEVHMKAFAVAALMGLGLLVGQLNGQEAAPKPVAEGAAIHLFEHVKYVDLHEMAPCAVPKIIEVNDPCACECKCECCDPCKKCCDACSACGECCQQKKVHIQICIPKCYCEEEVICRRDGDRLRYEYGEYSVDVRVRKGYIVVDYQD